MVSPVLLPIAIQGSMFISCGPPIASSVELFPCTLQCRTIWEIGNTCGGYGEDVKECICKYHYSWDGAIDSMYFADCPLCIEGLGDADVAATLRAWKTFWVSDLFECFFYYEACIEHDGDGNNDEQVDGEDHWSWTCVIGCRCCCCCWCNLRQKNICLCINLHESWS